LLLRHGILRRLALARESARRWYQHLRLEPIARRRFLAQRAAQLAAARGPHAGPTQEIAKKRIVPALTSADASHFAMP
jgi:hypothetical protein